MTNPHDLAQKHRDIFAAHRIELLECMGAGGEAPVFLARRTLLDGVTVRDCAVKIYEFRDEEPELPPQIRQQLSAMEHLQNQPDIVQLYEVIPHRQFVALVLERGLESLQDVLHRAREGVGFSRPICLEWFEPIARGLDAMHEANLYHGDVKPSNFLLCNGGQIKLCDFGTVMIADSLSTVIQPNQGTPAFLLPGYQKRPPRDRDHFALAASYYFVRTGRLPFGLEGPLMQELTCDGLDPDEADVLLPILKREIPAVPCRQWLTRLRSVSITAGPSFSERAGILVDRVESRRWKEGYHPDERDIDDLRHAQSLLDEHRGSAADSDHFQALRSRVLATLADCTKSEKLFTEALVAISRAIELAPNDAEHWAYRSELRLIADYGGVRHLPPMFVLGSRAFDAPNSPIVSAVETWKPNSLADSLADITKAAELYPNASRLARRALLLVLRGILLYRNRDFPGTEDLDLWKEVRPNDSCQPEVIWELHEDAFEMVFGPPIEELNRALALSQSPLESANILIQRAWSRAGFYNGAMENIFGNDSLTWVPGLWSLGAAIADLDQAHKVLFYGVSSPDEAPSQYQARSRVIVHSNEYHRRNSELRDIVLRKRRAYAMRLACYMDPCWGDLLSLLEPECTSDLYADCLAQLMRLSSGHELDERDHQAWDSGGAVGAVRVRNFLQGPAGAFFLPGALDRFFKRVRPKP